MTAGMERWVVEQASAGASPDAVLQPLLDEGWSEQEAVDAVAAAVNAHVARRGREQGLPPPSPVPVPVEPNGAWILDGGDRQVRVLASMRLPRVVALGGLLSDEECDAMIELARPRLQRSMTVEPDSGGDMVHPDRTSFGMGFARGEHPLCARIEARIARLLDWPLDHGEGLQVLNYGPGAQYKPHHDYFDPAIPGSAVQLRRGGSERWAWWPPAWRCRRRRQARGTPPRASTPSRSRSTAVAR